MVTIRPATPADAGGIARVHVETWRSAYRGIVADETLAALSVERRQAQWQRDLAREAMLAFVAVEDEMGSVVGFVCGGAVREGLEGYDSELYGLYLLDAYQGQGIGRALVERLGRALIAAGYRSMALWVLKDKESSRRFYERMGGKALFEKDFEIRGQPLQEVAYGWRDLSVFAEK